MSHSDAYLPAIRILTDIALDHLKALTEKREHMTIEDLTAQHVALVAYLKSKLSVADWHGVQDAASDLREIEAQLAILREIERKPMRPATVAEVEATSTKWASRLG